MNRVLPAVSGLGTWVVRPLAQCADWEAAWDRFAASVDGSILQRSVMAQAALRHFPATDVHLAVASDAYGTAAMTLLQPKRIGVWGMFETSQFPLGLWLQRPGVDLAALCSRLLKALPGWPFLFEGFNFDPRIVERPLKSASLRTIDHISTGAVDLEGSPEAFIARLDREETRKISKRERKAVEQFGDVKLERLTDPDAIKAAISAYAAVESQGWKAAAGTALTPGGSQVGFYEQILDAFAQGGRARAYKLYFGDRLAAVQLGVIDRTVAILLKSCHDETLRQLGPGLLLKRLVFESLITSDPHVKRVEFYGPYISAQRIWTTDVRKMYHINVYRTRLAAGLHDLFHHIAHRRSEAAPPTHDLLVSQPTSKSAPRTADAAPGSGEANLLRLPADLAGAELRAKTPFCALAWTRLLADTALPPGSRLHLARTPDLLLPLVQTGPARRLEALTSYYTPLFEPLTALAGAPLQAALDAVAADLAAARPRWSAIDLRPLDPDAEFFAAWRRALRARGYWVGTYACAGNWVADTAGLGGEAYMARRAKLRGTIRRARAKLAGEAAIELRITTAPGPALDADSAAFAAIYARSWRTAEPYPAFIAGLCRLAAREGWLRLGVLCVDGVPAAAQLWLVHDGVAYIFKIAYDEAYARHSVGSILTQHMVEHVLDVDRVRQIDYLVGDDDYKKRWMDRRRERCGLVAFDPRTLAGLAGALRHFGGLAMRRLRAARWLN